MLQPSYYPTYNSNLLSFHSVVKYFLFYLKIPSKIRFARFGSVFKSISSYSLKVFVFLFRLRFLRPVQTVTFFNPDSRLFLETPPTFLKLRPLLHLQTFLRQKVATFLKTNMFFIFWQKVRLFPTFI